MNDKARQPIDRYFSCDGLTLHYAEWGDPAQDPLILIHGNRDHSRSWDFFVAALLAQASRPLHVVALDLRGHGDSGWAPPERGYRHEDFLVDLVGLVRHLGKESCALIGHSLGGSTTLLFAGVFPAQVRKLIMIESTGPYARSEEEIPGLLAQWLESGGEETWELFYPTAAEAAKAIQNRFPKIPNEAAFHMARFGTRTTDRGLAWKYDPKLRFRPLSSFSENQVQAFIQRVDCPVLLICGSEGEFKSSPHMSRAGLFGNLRMVDISGAGHHVPHERPGELAEVIYLFLRDGEVVP